MKLFILKLLSLFVLCLGLISLAYNIGFAPVTDMVAQIPDQLVELQNNLPESVVQAKGVLEIKILWLIGSIVAIVFGIYGFVPRSTKWRKPKKISYDGPHGLVQIQLDTVEESLNRVLARMPEVKKIDVKVEPREGGRSALIKADVVLQHQAGQNARAIAGLVSDYIAETATKMLGLEELATIELNIVGINVNSRKSSKVIRKESLSHSGNAPVELLEASPKPMVLSAPGEPLGSGPVEEELEEDGGGVDAALEASAVGSVEEESKQAAARSELLEPLSLHEPAAEQTGEHKEASVDPGQEDDGVGESAESVEEAMPAIESPSVDGDVASVQVVPEPLGDLVDDDEHVESGADVTVPETDVEVPETDTPTDDLASPEEAPSPASPWAPLDTEPEPQVEMPDDFDANSSITVDSEGEVAAESNDPLESTEEGGATDFVPDAEVGASESTDSILGDLAPEGEEALSDSALESDGEEAASEDEPAQSEKKSWGWFN
ncbi:MAG: hypothetical protein L3K26_01755 [Candidatus Hydrogenedentes bacterium]|nr:hypothetical protein [Candidatus Hydrogenedentota bacterium]